MTRDYTDVLSEAGREASGSIVVVSEVVAASGVQGELEMLEVQCEVKDRLVVGRKGALLERGCEGSGGQDRR